MLYLKYDSEGKPTDAPLTINEQIVRFDLARSIFLERGL